MNKHVLAGLVALLCITMVTPSMAMDFTHTKHYGREGLIVGIGVSLLCGCLCSVNAKNPVQRAQQVKKCLKVMALGFVVPVLSYVIHGLLSDASGALAARISARMGVQPGQCISQRRHY